MPTVTFYERRGEVAVNELATAGMSVGDSTTCLPARKGRTSALGVNAQATSTRMDPKNITAEGKAEASVARNKQGTGGGNAPSAGPP
jgi:hypothetical protein